MIIRPITEKDRRALSHIAQNTGVGFSSLQPDEAMVANKLQWALESFAAEEPLPEAYYLFVLEDTKTGYIAGVAGIESAVGLSAPWYNYKVHTVVHASRKMEVYNKFKTLTLCSDHTGHSELCTLFLLPEHRRSGIGHLLSKSRMLYMKAHRHRFHENLIAELRGYCDELGESPFWEALGRHFFDMDFVHADQQVAKSKSFIAELMPRHAIYANLLPKEAQKVIGATHDDTVPARKLLEKEGFHCTGYVDIFDAGPLLEARCDDIRTIRETRRYKVKIGKASVSDDTQWLVSNEQHKAFRCLLATPSFDDSEYITITLEQAEALLLSEGDYLQAAPLLSTS